MGVAQGQHLLETNSSLRHGAVQPNRRWSNMGTSPFPGRRQRWLHAEHARNRRLHSGAQWYGIARSCGSYQLDCGSKSPLKPRALPEAGVELRIAAGIEKRTDVKTNYKRIYIMKILNRGIKFLLGACRRGHRLLCCPNPVQLPTGMSPLLGIFFRTPDCGSLFCLPARPGFWLVLWPTNHFSLPAMNMQQPLPRRKLNEPRQH